MVRDDTGREILDFASGQMCATIGHNVAELARTLARDWMPASLSKSVFVNTGPESHAEQIDYWINGQSRASQRPRWNLLDYLFAGSRH